ncbi:MAG TPA: ABC transporter substrate-binding protein [Thermomicrobiales bacterium]|nr:ABC transporter substrate-binding protein [Thermomicrobiales bacterium]
MNRSAIDTLVHQLRDGTLHRRDFVRRATALGLSSAAAGILARSAVAQDASPPASPTGTGEVIRSITREEAEAEIEEAFPFEEPQSQGGQLIHSMTTDISTLNTVLSGDLYSSWVSDFIYEQLVGTSVANGRDVPIGLADSWEIAADGVTYTVKLHEGVKWHDGEPFTADDVIFTFDMALDEKSQSPRKGTIDGTLASYEKVDDLTVKFVAKAPSAIFTSEALSQFGIMPKHIWENVPAADWPSDPGSSGQDPARVIGTGPFRFAEWVIGDHVTLEKNADYWNPKWTPVIDTYTYQVIKDPASNIAALQTGSSDFIEVPFGQAKSLRESNPELQVIDYDTLDINYYVANQDPAKGLFFTDVKVRQALQYALDREVIANTVFDGFAIRADGTQPVLSIAYAPDKVRTIYTYDPDKAKSLLDEAGWVEGAGGFREKDGQKLSFEMTYSEGYAPYEVQVPYMQQAWREVGVEMIPTVIPFPSLLEDDQAGNYQMSLLGFGWDPDGGQDAMFACNMIPPNGFNLQRYCSDAYDALVEPAKTELDVDKRIELLIEMSNIANDDAAVGITVFLKDIYGASPRVHNYFPNGYDTVWWLKRAWLDQG